MKTSNEKECAKIGLVTEKFEESEPAVTCTRCGKQAHDPSLLCSPSPTVASSTKLHERESH